MGEGGGAGNDVSMLKPSVFIRSSSNLQLTRTGIKSRTSLNFGQIGPLPLELIIIIITLFQEDNIFGTNASLIYGPQIQRHTIV